LKDAEGFRIKQPRRSAAPPGKRKKLVHAPGVSLSRRGTKRPEGTEKKLKNKKREWRIKKPTDKKREKSQGTRALVFGASRGKIRLKPPSKTIKGKKGKVDNIRGK